MIIGISSEPKGGENGADINGNVVWTKVKSISGNSKFTQAGNPLILDATVNFDPNPTKGEIGYDPEKDIVDTISLVIPLKPGKMTVASLIQQKLISGFRI